jgi:DNA replication licensing factor MCM4
VELKIKQQMIMKNQSKMNFLLNRLVPRAQYTNEKGTSGVGLIAYVTKDPETGQLVLQT